MASRAQLDLEVQMKGADKAAGDLKGISKEANLLGKAMGGLKGGLGAIGGAMTIATGAAGIFGGAMLGAAKAAADEQVGIDRLNQTLKNVIPNWDGNTAAVEAYISKTERLAFADDELRDSLNALVMQTGDLTEAQNLQAIAMDLARAKGMDLETASKLVGKVDAENIGILARYGIQIDENATKEEALAIIREKTAGQAQTFADSAAGSMERAQNAIGNAVETIGGKVLGMLEGPLKGFADWLQSPDFQAFADGAAAVLGAAFEAMGNTIKWVLDNVITPLWNFFSQPEVQTNLQNIAGVIGGALVAAFDGLKTAAGWVFDNILKPLFEWLSQPAVKSAIEGIASAIGTVLAGAWTALSTAATFVWENILKPFFEWVGTPEVSNTIGSIANAIGTVLGGAFDVLRTAAEFVWNNILSPIWNFFTTGDVANAIGSVANGIGTVLGGAFDALTKAAGAAWQMIQDVWNFLTGQAASDAESAGESAVASFGTGLSTGMVTVANNAKIAAALAGESITAGVKEGIERTKDVPFIGMNLALIELETATMNKLESKSPSQVYARLGETIPAGLGQGITDNTSTATGPMDTLVGAVFGIAQTALTVANYNPFGLAVAAGIAGGITSGTGADMLAAGAAAGAGGGAVGAASNLAAGVKNAISAVITFDYFKGAGEAVSGGIQSGILALHAAAVTAATSLATGIQAAVAAVITWATFNGYGLAVGNGLRDGINTSAVGAIAAARNMVNAINAEVARKLEVGSPSRIAMYFGEQYAAGFALGVANGTPMVSRATAAMIRGAAGDGVRSMPITFGNIVINAPGANAPDLADRFIDELRIRLRSAEMLSTGGGQRVWG